MLCFVPQLAGPNWRNDWTGHGEKNKAKERVSDKPRICRCKKSVCLLGFGLGLV